MQRLLKGKRNIIIVDALIVLLTLFVLLLSIKDPIITSNTVNLDKYVYIFVLPAFILTIAFLIFGLFIEHKYNKLNFKNLILLFGGIIFFNNLLMVLILPSSFVLVSYNGVPYVMNITISQRIYSIIISGLIGLMPFLLIYVIPKFLYTKKSFKIFLLIYLIVCGGIAFTSLFTDFNAYINILKSGFTDFSKPVVSILKSKFTFSLFIFIGIVASTVLECITKKKRYIIYAVLLLIVNLFTFSKLPILLSYLYFLVFACIKLFPILFKNKNNKTITVMVLSFAVIISSILITLTVFSNTGLLFKIKQVFQNVIESSKKTFSSRLIIWESAFNTLKPYQIIFGFGFYLGDIALNISYNNNPNFPSWDNKNIFHCHNAFIECIQLGGIVYLMFYILLIIICIKYIFKIRKKYRDVAILMFAYLGYTLINGITDSLILFSDSQYIVFSSFFALVIMGLYYYSVDTNELLKKKDLITSYDSERRETIKGTLNRLNYNMKLLIINDIKKDKELMERIKNLK